ncbi:MAG TPA: hypothetical protein DHV89_04255 [Ruminococcus sp.]|nr:hypothetical protein [Ruminococcus sp.]
MWCVSGITTKTYIFYYSILAFKNQQKKTNCSKIDPNKKTPVGVFPDGCAAYDRASAAAAFLPDLR